jgi:NAD(P)-dependent dehydrogenase (short-subunit alcohol dehydrogenase family)
MADLNSKVVLITGASSGIGEGTARVLATSGARLVLGARRTDKLKKIAEDLPALGGNIRYCALDVTKLDDIDEIADGVYRLSTCVPAAAPGGFPFNQFLIDGDDPLLFHTGPRAIFHLCPRRSPASLRSSESAG